MKKTRKTTKSKRNSTKDSAQGTSEFSCHAPEAQSVFLAGTFNDWNPDAHPMKRDDEGTWQTSLELSPGRYEFKFIVDGEWCCLLGDDASPTDCPDCVTNEFGTKNRVLQVTANTEA